MSRLPTHYADQLIRFRIPRSQPGELVVAMGAQAGTPFPDATFLSNNDKPYEIHRLGIRISPMDNNAQPAQISPAAQILFPELATLLQKYVRIRIEEMSTSAKLNAVDQRVDGLLDQLTGFWEFEEPYTVVKGQQFQVFVTNDLTVPFTLPNQGPTIGNLRIELTWVGFNLVVAPPSETR
jgi:hypothetical protein